MWHFLLPAFAAFLVGAGATYWKPVRDSWLFPAAYVTAAAIGCCLWVVGSRRAAAGDRLVEFSLWWDALMVAAYYAIPLLVIGRGMNAGAVAGACLAVVGLAVFKYYSS